MAGESIFKDESMWQLYVKGQSKQTASTVKAGFASDDHAEDAGWTPETSAENFRKSIADGWVWLDFISISQTIGCQTEEIEYESRTTSISGEYFETQELEAAFQVFESS